MKDVRTDFKDKYLRIDTKDAQDIGIDTNEGAGVVPPGAQQAMLTASSHSRVKDRWRASVDTRPGGRDVAAGAVVDELKKPVVIEEAKKLKKVLKRLHIL